MRVHFHGAAGEVTGSLHEVEAAGRRLLLDCGMIQGDRTAASRNLAPFDVDPATIDALIVSHAHIDHIGRIPLLVRRGFRGPILAQAATADLMPVMLLDSAALAEADAERANRHRREGEALRKPLYTRDDVQAAMKLVRPLPYGQRTQVLPGVELAFRDAGHILGSAIVELWAEGRKLVYSGDLGVKGTPILCDPTPLRDADLVLMESTYGDRDHRTRAATVHEIGDILEHAWREGGNVLIPAFAVGRSQELLYWFARYHDDWKLGRWRIFLDSPMAAKVIGVYARHTGLFDAQARQVWAQRPDPFHLPGLRISESLEDSMAINRLASGAIIIAGSGMANGGRIVHHLKHNLGRRQAHVVFVGYQAEGTLGRRLVDRARWVRIHGEEFHVNAQVHTVGGLSAHADQSGLLDWYGRFEGPPRLALVHGEMKAREALAEQVHARFGVRALQPMPGESVEV
jgi:metallo-beta-lactamase family protein